MDIRSEKLRDIAFEGNFGLEREALRISGIGCFAATPHPFPGSSRIVRDFCENLTRAAAYGAEIVLAYVALDLRGYRTGSMNEVLHGKH